MELKKYLKNMNLTKREFAELLTSIRRMEEKNDNITCSVSSVVNWCSGKACPSLVYMRLIQKMTYGKVTMQDFVNKK